MRIACDASLDDGKESDERARIGRLSEDVRKVLGLPRLL